MNHEQAVQQKATERYLLDELDPEQRDQFEEHLFDCQDCALDLRSTAMFVEQSKTILAEEAAPHIVRVPAATAKPGWFAWLRPALAVPIMAVLLTVIGVQFARTKSTAVAVSQPEVGPWISVSVPTRGPESRDVMLHRGEGFSIVLNIIPDKAFTSYMADLYNPAGKVEWSGQIMMASAEDARQIHVPGGDRQSGTYKLVIEGITSAGDHKVVTSQPIDVKIQ